MSRAIRLPVRHYRAIPIDAPGYEEEVLNLDLDTTAIVAIHCWNIGCPDGPEIDIDYCVGGHRFAANPGITVIQSQLTHIGRFTNH